MFRITEYPSNPRQNSKAFITYFLNHGASVSSLSVLTSSITSIFLKYVLAKLHHDKTTIILALGAGANLRRRAKC